MKFTKKVKRDIIVFILFIIGGYFLGFLTDYFNIFQCIVDMPVEIIFKVIIYCFVGAGMFQINKWLRFKEQENKWKEGWNNFVMLFCIIIYIATSIFLFDNNF